MELLDVLHETLDEREEIVSRSLVRFVDRKDTAVPNCNDLGGVYDSFLAHIRDLNYTIYYINISGQVIEKRLSHGFPRTRRKDPSSPLKASSIW